jgi:hypothetical protein
VIVLGFDWEKRVDPPHRHRVIATHAERGVTFKLVENWPRTTWWLTASDTPAPKPTDGKHPGLGGGWGGRRATGLKTTSKRVAELWRRELEAGAVALENWTKGEPKG